MRSFVREKRVYAGEEYMEVSLFTRTVEQERYCKSAKRSKRKNVSRPVQNNLNDRNSKRYAKLLIYANFTRNDYYLTFTYNDKHLPKTPAEGKKHQDNTLRKLKRLYEKSGKELKYMWFTSYQFDDETGYIKRIHHHVLVNGGVDRDEVEKSWSLGRGKKKEMLGRTQARLIQPGENGLDELIKYLTVQEKWENRQWKKGQKKYSSSKNLVKPQEVKNDHVWSLKKLGQIGLSNDAGEEQILKRFPGYQIVNNPEPKYHDDLGWYVQYELIKISEWGNS
ncbi:rolling circle replication-associated protein [Enterococcus sp. AZ102]|uniref:rolling circle replication-associated protein n=1 Tax=Enterococcus sp. AZ102 TaxID=2774865 RepID=UPI003F234A2F